MGKIHPINSLIKLLLEVRVLRNAIGTLFQKKVGWPYYRLIMIYNSKR